MFSDITDQIDVIGEAMHTLSEVYERGRAQLDASVELDLDGATATVDREALHEALTEFSPKVGKRQLEGMATTLEHGLLVNDGTLIAPAAMLLDPHLSPVVDIIAWQTMGIHPGASVGSTGKQLRALFPNIPPAVVTPENLARLLEAANREQARVAAFESYCGLPSGAFQHRNGGPADPPVKGGAMPPNHSGYPNSGTWGSHDPIANWIDGYVEAATCLTQSNWTIHGFGVEVCMDRSCADKVQAALYGPDPATFWALVGQLLLKVLILAVTAAGWVSTAITTGESYWGLMISKNKSDRGVCLFIPGPWTFGVLGPGWALGR